MHKANSNLDQAEDYVSEFLALETETEKPSFKKKFSGFKLFLKLTSLVLTACLILILAFFSLESLAKSQVDNCKNYLHNKEIVGLEVDFDDCKSSQYFDLIPDVLGNRNNFAATKQNLENLEIELKNQLEFEQNKVKLLQKQSDILEVEYVSFLEENSENKNASLSQQIDKEKIVAVELEKNLQTGLIKMQADANYFEFLIQQNSDKNLIEFEEFLTNFKTANQDEQIELFPELKKSTAKLRLSIADQISAEFDQNGFRKLTSQQFQDLIMSLPAYNSFEEKTEVAEVTGNQTLDQQITNLAKERGYKKQFQLDSTAISQLGENQLLPEIFTAFDQMVAVAGSENIELGLTSSYRSTEEQREIFLKRLKQNFEFLSGKLFVEENYIDPKMSEAIQEVLETTAPPGFSRHHSGLALDLKSSTEVFAESPGFAWISKNNYAKAKEFGFVPSYPEGVTAGPEPEAWEYIFVGQDVLRAQ